MWGDAVATWADPCVTWAEPERTTVLTLHGDVRSIDIAINVTGTTVTVRIEPD